MSRLSDSLRFDPEATLRTTSRGARDAESAATTNQTVTITDLVSTTQPSPTVTVATNTTFNLTSEALNVTSTLMAPTEPHAANRTSLPTGATTEHTGDGGGNMGGTIAAIVITVILVVAFIGAIVYLYLRRRWQPHKKSVVCFQPIRKRRSSTSDSRRTLEELTEEPDKMVNHHDDHNHAQNAGSRRSGSKRRDLEERDAFTIDDLEDPEDEVSRGDEYYYDEVFGQSQFEDEATQNAVRQLYSTGDDQREEELLDFDFETLGIKIEDYKIDPSRRTVDFS